MTTYRKPVPSRHPKVSINPNLTPTSTSITAPDSNLKPGCGQAQGQTCTGGVGARRQRAPRPEGDEP